jgi:hypothetical protein
MRKLKSKKPSRKLDLYKQHAAEYVSPRKPVLIKTSPAQYLAIAGRGDPNGADFQGAVGALYNVAFTIKMAMKFAGRDYAVSKLEAQWWVEGASAFMDTPRSDWQWKLMIRTPEFISPKNLAEAVRNLRAKGKPEAVSAVRLENINEGRVVQMLHVGPYTEEAPTIAQMEKFSRENGVAFHGRHHEIYLSDPRRVAPAKLRTILRYPVR